MRIRTIAKRIPQPIKNTLKAAYGAIPPRLRLGRAFWETYTFLQESQRWDAGRLQEYQMRQLERLLAHCYANVPYYRRVFDERGLTPSQIQSLSDLQKLPYLRKEQIRREPQAFLARNRRQDRLEHRYTTGTSGQPLQFPVDHDELEREWAFAFHQWSRVGYVPGDVRAEVRGTQIHGPEPYEWDPIVRTLRLSPVVKDKEMVQLYLDMIRSNNIRFLYGYPSSLTYLASLITRFKLGVNLKLTALLFASETLYPWQRSLAEEVFGCRSYNFYGMAEHVVIAGECESSRAFHCMPQYGITEVDPKTGEIAGTGFLNHAHPFIRYRTADVATLPIQSGCPACGRSCFPVLADVEGRLQDFVLTPEGVPICSCVLTFPFKHRRTIGRVQIVQETFDRVILRSAPVGDVNAHYEAELAEAYAGLQQILGEGVTIRKEGISPEEYLNQGKLRFILSHLPREIRCYDGTGESHEG